MKQNQYYVVNKFINEPKIPIIQEKLYHILSRFTTIHIQ